MKLEKKLKLSIIIPNYNWGQFLEWCLNSIINQDYNNYEIIIVDWKSCDNSHEIIIKYVNLYSNIKWIDTIDSWISNAFNIWIENATWDYILLLWSDDYLNIWIFTKLISYINNINNFWCVDIKNCNIFCDSINYWSNKNELIKRTPQTSFFSKNNLIKFWNIIWFQNIYINKNWLKNYKINEKNKFSMDYETYFDMLNNWEKFIYLPEINSINYLWNNTTCKYWYNSQKEANWIALKNSTNIINYVYVFKRFLVRVLLKLFKN